MWKALDPDTLVAFEMNGEPLSRWHGFPARLVVPGWTATYWVKALTELTVLDKPFEGFWMKTGYRVPKDVFGPSRFESQDSEQNSPITAIRVNSLVVDPSPARRLRAGSALKYSASPGTADRGSVPLRCRSTVAQAGTRPGLIGTGAAMHGGTGALHWMPRRSGSVVLMARARANDGSTQGDTLIPNPAGYHHNLVQKVEYRVA